MANLFALDLQQYLYLILFFFRISAILFTAPITGSPNVPAIIKINLALVFSLLIFNLVPHPNIAGIYADSYGLIILAAKEVLLGIFLGMIPRIVFAAIDLAGGIISFTIGFSTANLFDPTAGANTQTISVFKNIFLVLIFLAINAHHVIFEAILLSFKTIPVADLTVSTNLYDSFTKYIGELFFIGLRLAYPLIVVILLTNIIFGLLAKSIPQMNVFIIGMPLTILVGMILLMFSIPFTASVMQSLLFENMEYWIALISGWK